MEKPNFGLTVRRSLLCVLVENPGGVMNLWAANISKPYFLRVRESCRSQICIVPMSSAKVMPSSCKAYLHISICNGTMSCCKGTWKTIGSCMIAGWGQFDFVWLRLLSKGDAHEQSLAKEDEDLRAFYVGLRLWFWMESLLQRSLNAFQLSFLAQMLFTHSSLHLANRSGSAYSSGSRLADCCRRLGVGACGENSSGTMDPSREAIQYRHTRVCTISTES